MSSPDDPVSAVLFTGSAESMGPLATTKNINLVRGSTVPQDDDTWTVIAYPTQSAISDLQTRDSGINVAILAEPEELQDRWSAVPVPAESHDLTYKNSSQIDSAVNNLVSSHRTTCGRLDLDNPTYNNITVPALRLQANPQSTIPVLFTGGVHGNELVPPDALLSFCDNLLTAFDAQRGVDYLPFTDGSGTTYASFTIDKAAVARILNTFTLFVVPCVNPDGRDYSLSGQDKAHKLWRTNCRPPDGNDQCGGVDINRNFPIAWDADIYFSPAAIPDVNTSKDPCDAIFRGYTQAPPPNAQSTEPETQNLINLVAQQRIQYLVDVHMLGRTVLYPWGMDWDQSTDQSQTFFNTAYDGKRDGKKGSAYGEYVPNSSSLARGQLLDRLRELADAMVTAIGGSVAGSSPTAIARSIYTAKQSVGLYPTTGVFDDYTFAQQFLNLASATTYAFTLECGYEKKPSTGSGADDDGGMTPNLTKQYPKVEREVHAALFGFLAAIPVP